MSAENKLIEDAHFGVFKSLQEKLAEKRDIGLVKTYFLHFKKNPCGDAGFGTYLRFLTQVILPQINEKYDDNAKKYDSKEKYEKYQSGLFDVLVEVNDYLWENYLFLDRSLRLEYADKVISKINGGCLKRFLCTRKDEIKKSGDQKKISAYNKVLDGFFYRNIRSLIFSREQCKDLSAAFNKNNVDNLPDWIDQYIDSSNQDNSSTALSDEFVTLTNKLESFNWNETLDENDKIAKECLEDIKKINKDVTDPNLFDLYMNFLKEAIIPQINELLDGVPYQEQYANGLFEILFETNDLIWKILGSNSLSEYEKKRLSARYYDVIEKINSGTWKRIGNLLYKRKEEAIKSRKTNKVVGYNELVKNLILRNLEDETISVSDLYWLGVPNLIDEKTFEEYTDDSMVKKLFAYAAIKESRLGDNVGRRSTIKIRKLGKGKKICLESICGRFISGKRWAAFDDISSLIGNNPDDIDFDFTTINESTLKSNDNLKNFFFGFSSIYDSLAKNNFHVAPNYSKLKLKILDVPEHLHLRHEKVFSYLGSWIIPLLGEKTDFDTAYKILSKRFDSLCTNSKIKIDKQVKDKLIIQTLVYATNSLSPLSEESNVERSIYRTLMMITGEKKIVEGHEFTLDDIKKILLSAKESVLAPIKVFKFCKDHRAKDVHITDLIKLVHDMKLPFYDSDFMGDFAYLCNDRAGRCGKRFLLGKGTNVFNQNDFEAYITELPDNLKEEEFDILFLIFEFRSAFEEERSSDENKKIQKLFIKVVNKIPTEYLSQKKFDSLADYFTQCNTNNAIDLTRDEFNKFMSKINKQMDSNDFAKFKIGMIKYFRIDGRKISDQEIEDAYKDVKDVENADFKDINAIEGVNEIQEVNNNAIIDSKTVQDINASKSINKNINEVESAHELIDQNINEFDPENNTFEENMAEAPIPVCQDINKNVKPITNNNQNQTQKLDESDKVAKIKSDIEQEKQEFESWVSGKLKNNKFWYLVMWVFRLWFKHKLEKKLKDLKALESINQQSKNNSLNTNTKEKEEKGIPKQNNKTETGKDKNE